MPAANYNVFFWAVITLKDVTTGASTSVNLSTRPIDDSTAVYYPLLLNIGSLGVMMGDWLPNPIGGDLVIDNSPSSLGEERRFSDLFERLTCIDQQVLIYGAAINDEICTPSTDGVLLFKANVATWNTNPNNNTLTLKLTCNLIPKRNVCYTIDSTEYPDAPTSSIGCAVPLVVGVADVAPIRVTADGDLWVQWAYATTLGTDYYPLISAGVEYYAKAADDKFYEVTSASSVSTPVVNHTITTGGYDATSSGSSFGLLFSTTDGYVITQVETKCYGGNMGSGDCLGSMTLAIYDVSPSGNREPVGTALGSANVLGDDWRIEILANAEYTVVMPLDKPVVLKPNSEYWFIWSIEHGGGNPLRQFLPSKTASTSTIDFCYRLQNASWITYYSGASGYDRPYALYGIEIEATAPTSANDEGFGLNVFTVSQVDTGTGFPLPSLDNINWVVRTKGIQEYPIGAPGFPHCDIYVLLTQWDGTNWGNSLLSTTKYSATWDAILDQAEYCRYDAGACTSNTSLEQLLSDLCRSTMCRLALNPNSSTPFGCYVFGTHIESSATITNEECEIERIYSAGTESIVNRITGKCQKRLVNLNQEKQSSQGTLNQYDTCLTKPDSSDPASVEITEASQAVYGLRYLKDQALNFAWGGQGNTSYPTGTLANLLNCYLRRFGKPDVWVEFTVPLFKYQWLDLFDVVTLLHPELPAYFGTSANASKITVTGDTVDVNKGEPTRRAVSYRAQIEGREINFNVGGYPRLKLTARLLLNYPFDPT